MKKWTFFGISRLVLAILFVNISLSGFSQCVPDSTAPAIAGIYPDSLDDANGCMFFEQVVTFILPRDTTIQIAGQTVSIPFNYFRIDGIAGLPLGMSWECNMMPDCEYDVSPGNANPDTAGCIRIFGTPTIPNSYQLVVYIIANVDLLGDQQGTYTLPLTVTPCEYAGTCYNYTVSSNCEPAALQLTNNVPSNGKDGFTYDWEIKGPNGFLYDTSDENPFPQMLIDAGTYVIDYQASIDTVGFLLSGISIDAVGCDDPLGDPDLYWILKDPSGTELINTIANPIDNATLPVGISVPNLLLDTGMYEFQVWDEDPIIADGGCADGTTGGGASVFFTIPTTSSPLVVTNNQLTVTFSIDHPIQVITCSDTIQVDSLPEQPLVMAPADTNSICNGETIELTTMTNDSLQWYKDGLPLLDAHDTSLVVSEAGAYSVEVIDRMSLCTQLSEEIIVEVITIPTPSIAFDGQNTMSVAAPNMNYQYNWYDMNGALAGNGASWMPASSGNYYATALDTATNCESNPSVTLNVLLTDLEALQSVLSSFSIFPNPAHRELNISLELVQFQEVEIRLQDMYGKSMLQHRLGRQIGHIHEQLNLSELSRGIYLVTLQLEQGTVSRKIVVQ